MYIYIDTNWFQSLLLPNANYQNSNRYNANEISECEMHLHDSSLTGSAAFVRSEKKKKKNAKKKKKKKKRKCEAQTAIRVRTRTVDSRSLESML